MRARTSKRLDGGHCGLHGLGDLVVGESVDLAQQQGGALRLGELVDVGYQLAEALAAEHLVAGGDAVLGEVDVHAVHADGGGAAQMVEGAVAGDAVEPGPHVDLALVCEHGVEGGGEHLLEDVLGVLTRAEHVAAEGQQARLVARAERLEGGRLALAGERYEALVGLQAQQSRRAAQARHGAGMWESGDLHGNGPMLPSPPTDTVARQKLRLQPCQIPAEMGERPIGRGCSIEPFAYSLGEPCPGGGTVYAFDLKSMAQRACGFDSHPGHSAWGTNG